MPDRNIIMELLHQLSRPQSALVGAVRDMRSADPEKGVLSGASRGWNADESESWRDVLTDEGADPNAFSTKAGGFIGDVVLDPLNAIGVAKKVVKGASVLTGADKAVDAAIATTKAAMPKKVVDFAVRNAHGGRYFDKYADLRTSGQDVVDIARLHHSKVNALRPQIASESADLLAGLADDTTAKEITYALEKGGGSQATQAYIPKVRQAFDDTFDEGLKRGVFDAPSKSPNYVPYDFSEKYSAMAEGVQHPFRPVNAKNPHSQPKTVQGIDNAVRLGAEEDIRKILPNYMHRVKKAGADADFIDQIVAKVGQAVPAQGGKVAIPAGRVPLSIPMDKTLKAIMEAKHGANMTIPAEAAKYLQSLQGTSKALPETVQSLLAGYDKALQGFKTFATIARPGHHMTNAKGNIYNLDMADQLSAEGVRNATKWASGNGLDDVGQNAGKDIEAYLRQHNLIQGVHQGSFEDIYSNTVGDLVQKKLSAQAPSKNFVKKGFNAYMGGMKKLGGGIEDTSKMAGFVEALRQGDGLDKALLRTKDTLFDYSELAPFEKEVMRRIFPFYTFSRKNLPFQVKKTLQNPQKVARLDDVVTLSERNAKQNDTDLDPALRPAWMNTRAMPLQVGEQTFIEPNLPLNDISLLDPSNVGKEIMGRIGPLMSVPWELGQNRNEFGKEIYTEGASLPTKGIEVAKYLVGQAPLLSTASRASQWKSTGPFDPDQAINDALNFTLAPSLYGITPAQQKENLRRNQMREKKAIKADFGTEETLQRAMELLSTIGQDEEQ